MYYTVIKEIEDYKDNYGDKKTVEKYENRVLASKDEELIFWFYQNIKNVHLEKLVDFVVSTKNINLVRSLLDSFPKALNIKLFKLIFEYNNFDDFESEYYYDYSEFFDTFIYSNERFFKSHKSEILNMFSEYGNMELSETLLSFCNNLDVDITGLVFSLINGGKRAFKFNKKNVDVLKLENLVLNSESITNLFWFMETYEITKDDGCKYQNYIIKYGTYVDLWLFLEKIEEIDKRKVIENFINNVNFNDFLYQFPYPRFDNSTVLIFMKFCELCYTLNVSNINKLNKLITECKDINNNYLLCMAAAAQNTNFKSKDELFRLILQSSDVEFLGYIDGYNALTGGSRADEIKKIVEENPIEHFSIMTGINKDACDSMEDKIINSGDYGLMFEFIKKNNQVNIVKFENSIINDERLHDEKKADLLYQFACNVKGADISKLENAIIEIGIIKYIYLFAKNVKSANISKLENAIYTSKTNFNDEELMYIRDFAKNIKGVNISNLFDVYARHGGTLGDFAFNNAVTLKIIKNLIKSNDVSKLVEFFLSYDINEYKKNNFGLVLDFILSDNVSLDDLYLFVSEVLFTWNYGITIEILDKILDKFLNAIKLSDIEIYSYVKDIAQSCLAVDIDKIENCLIDNKLYSMIIDFSKSVFNVNISKLEDAIIDSNELEYIYTFMFEVPSADIYKLYSAILELDPNNEIDLLSFYEEHNYSVEEATRTKSILSKVKNGGCKLKTLIPR